ncbi:MAG: hypothetical protein U0997_06390 [Sulfurimicrobium sp.]|nr:hypothetical protein [Sulfurimicrobium sp.]
MMESNKAKPGIGRGFVIRAFYLFCQVIGLAGRQGIQHQNTFGAKAL